MFLLWLLTGLFGGHRFYVGKIGSGILYLFTGGFFFIGWALDFFSLGSMVDNYNMMHGYAGGNRNQNTNTNANTNNVVINMAMPQQPMQQPMQQQPVQQQPAPPQQPTGNQGQN